MELFRAFRGPLLQKLIGDFFLDTWHNDAALLLKNVQDNLVVKVLINTLLHSHLDDMSRCLSTKLITNKISVENAVLTRGPLWLPGTLQKSFVKAKISSMMFSVGIKVDESGGQVACDEISVMLLL